MIVIAFYILYIVYNIHVYVLSCVNVLWCHWAVHLKMIKIANFLPYVFYHNWKRTQGWGEINRWWVTSTSSPNSIGQSKSCPHSRGGANMRAVPDRCLCSLLSTALTPLHPTDLPSSGPSPTLKPHILCHRASSRVLSSCNLTTWFALTSFL